jgi:hypothetical protein
MVGFRTLGPLIILTRAGTAVLGDGKTVRNSDSSKWPLLFWSSQGCESRVIIHWEPVKKSVQFRPTYPRKGWDRDNDPTNRENRPLVTEQPVVEFEK